MLPQLDAMTLLQMGICVVVIIRVYQWLGKPEYQVLSLVPGVLAVLSLVSRGLATLVLSDRSAAFAADQMADAFFIALCLGYIVTTLQVRGDRPAPNNQKDDDDPDTPDSSGPNDPPQ